MAAEKGRKILVAIDESEESTYALTWCLDNIVSGSSNDTLIPVFAKTPLAIHSAMDSTGYMFSSSIITTMEKYGNEVARSVMEKATKICKELKNDEVKVETKVEHGDPRDVICEVADRLKVDLLIMGSHGYGAIKRAFLGSVSSHCAQNVKCPVLIVKKPPKSDQPKPTQTT